MNEDNFVYNLNVIIFHTQELKETQRNMLKVTAMLFNSLNLTSPVVFQAKLIFIQSLIETSDSYDVLEVDTSPKWIIFLKRLGDIR